MRPRGSRAALGLPTHPRRTKECLDGIRQGFGARTILITTAEPYPCIFYRDLRIFSRSANVLQLGSRLMTDGPLGASSLGGNVSL